MLKLKITTLVLVCVFIAPGSIVAGDFDGS